MQIDLSQITGTTAIITAAGTGRRMGTALPKQYLEIQGKTVLETTVDKFLSHTPISLIVIVVSPDDSYLHQLTRFSQNHLHTQNNKQILVVKGGVERVDSVLNALRFLSSMGLPAETPVMVHDAARPCVTDKDLTRLSLCYENDKKPCALLSPVTDSLHRVDSNNRIVESVNRNGVVRALTPQMASLGLLLTALEDAVARKLTVTDEISALAKYGESIQAVEGSIRNIKITHPGDLELATMYLQQE